MRTAKEWVEETKNKNISLAELIKQSQSEAIDETVKACAESAELIEDDGRCEPPYCYIDKQSILSVAEQLKSKL